MQSEQEQLKELLGNKEYRLFSGRLYYIKDKYGKKIPFIPNEAQTNYYKNRHTKNIILKARQLGFSTFIDIDKLDDFLFSSYSNYGIIAQDIDSANFIFNEKVKFAFDNLPEWLKNCFKLKTDRKGEIKSENNQNSISVDTSFRGGTLQGLHISEYGKICNKYPEKAREIQTGALNTLAPESRVDIESTAEGNSGYFYEMTMKAIEFQEQKKELTNMDYKFHFYPWFIDKTYTIESDDLIRQETKDYLQKVIENEWIQKQYPGLEFTDGQMRWYQKKLEEQKDDMQREFPSYPKEAFDLAIKGAYYEKELAITRSQGRVGRYFYDNRLPVYTVWDLGGAGGGDETAIRFFQLLNKEVRLIDYWEGTGYGLTEIAMSIVNPRYDNYNTHYLPHDAEVTEYSTGVARIQTARNILKGKVEVVAKLSISDGINAVRDMFPNCYFNEEKTFTGLSRLAGYRREYDEKNGVFRDKPKHDINSNACFEGNQIINTPNGLVKIKNIKVGDFVLTPKGYKKVINVFNNGIKKTNIYYFNNGKKIICTPSHLFYVKNRGYKSIDTISYSDTIETINYLPKLIWKYNILTEKLTNLENDRNIGVKRIKIKCIKMFGFITIEKYLNDIIYIIKIKTLGIMIYLIWNWLKVENIYQNIEKKNGKIQTLNQKGGFDLKKQEKKQRNGIEVKNEKNGIKNIMNEGKISFLKNINLYANFVEKNTKQIEKYQVNSVQIIANQHKEEKIDWTIYQKVVYIVMKLFYQINTIMSKDVKIVSIKEYKETYVYDIEVENEHCYYVDGLLVHNCDSFRYLGVVYKNLTIIEDFDYSIKTTGSL